MHDYKNHRPARPMPDWIKVCIGFIVGMPCVYLFVILALSGAGL